MSSLVLIRTLRDSTDPVLRKPLQKMLILEGQDGSRTNCATNKTRVNRDFEQGVTCGALVWKSTDFRSLISKVFCHPTLLSPTDLLAVFWRSITNLTHLTLHSTAYNKASPTSRCNRA